MGYSLHFTSLLITPLTNSKLFVFWVGNYSKGYLQGLADLEFVSTQNLDQELERFFQSLGVSLSGLQTLFIEVP